MTETQCEIICCVWEFMIVISMIVAAGYPIIGAIMIFWSIAGLLEYAGKYRDIRYENIANGDFDD